MRQNPSYKLSIAGHTDSVGSSASNQALSQRRADAVYNQLVTKIKNSTEQPINPSRLVSKGYGEVAPIGDNETDAGRQKNRRTEARIISQ